MSNKFVLSFLSISSNISSNDFLFDSLPIFLIGLLSDSLINSLVNFLFDTLLIS